MTAPTNHNRRNGFLQAALVVTIMLALAAIGREQGAQNTERILRLQDDQHRHEAGGPHQPVGEELARTQERLDQAFEHLRTIDTKIQIEIRAVDSESAARHKEQEKQIAEIKGWFKPPALQNGGK